MHPSFRAIALVMPLLLLAACGTASPAFPARAPEAVDLPLTEDEVPRVSVEQAKAALESGAAVVVDVRSAESYAAGHIPGAISIPLSEFENDLRSLPLEKDRWIITYCT